MIYIYNNKSAINSKQVIAVITRVDNYPASQITEVSINRSSIDVYFGSCKWINFDMFGKNDLYCGHVSSEISIDNFADTARKYAMLALSIMNKSITQ